MTDVRMHRKAVHEQLLSIRDAHGELTPQVVVDEARDETHPLHPHFEWDDVVAGEAYRRVQAAELIRSVKIVYKEAPDGEERTVRAWSTLGKESKASEQEHAGYSPTDELLKDDFSRKLLLRQCERDARSLQRKYGHLEEFAGIVAGVMRDAS